MAKAPFRLTSLAHCAGWAAKFSPEDLGQVLSRLPKQVHPDLLVGVETADDAAVYRLTSDLALVQTLDFFPPIVDDAYFFGAIAVANSLSDVYAMGGKPLLALNILCFPVDLDREILAEILHGGYDKAREADVLIVGGHTVDDPEPKYGLAVTGVVKPGHQVTNAGAKPGDVLVLTKPLGTGTITTAAKAGAAPDDVLQEAVDTMATLNRAAAEAMVAVGVNACTDVTGFGLLGHLKGMVVGSGVGARISFGAIPRLRGALELLKQGFVPGGSRRNFASLYRHVRWSPSLDEDARLFLCDAQTSGGLLIAVPQERAKRLLGELQARQVPVAVEIGEVVPDAERRILVEP